MQNLPSEQKKSPKENILMLEQSINPLQSLINQHQTDIPNLHISDTIQSSNITILQNNAEIYKN